MSFGMAAFFLSCSVFLVMFSFVFIAVNQNKISHTPDKLENFSALFMEVDNKSEPATYFYVLFFGRRMVFSFGLVAFYMVAHAQVSICIVSSGFLLFYLVMIRPYKEKILNIYSIFNEICTFFCSLFLLAFDPIEIEGTTKSFSNNQIYAGWGVVAMISLCLIGNFVYLFPVKMCETYVLLKALPKKLKEICRRSKNDKIRKFKQILTFI